MIVLDAGVVLRLPLEYAPVGVVAEAVAPPQLLLDPGHAVVVLLRLFLRDGPDVQFKPLTYTVSPAKSGHIQTQI